MNTAAASNPEDLFDLSPYEGSWEGVVEHLTDAANAPIVIHWIRTGSLPPNFRFSAEAEQFSDRAVREILADFDVEGRPRTKLRAALAMNTVERTKVGFGYGKAHLRGLIEFAANSRYAAREEVVTLEDLETLAPAFGFQAIDLVEVLASPSRQSHLQTLMTKTVDFDDFVLRNIAEIQRLLSKPVRDHRVFWETAEALSARTLGFLLSELAVALTSNSKHLRAVALKRAQGVRYHELVPELQGIAVCGRPAERFLAAEYMLTLAPEGEAQEAIEWIKCELAADKSAKVRELAATLSDAPVELVGRHPTPELPDLTIPPLPLTISNHLEARGYSDITAILRGEKRPGKYYLRIKTLLNLLTDTPHLVNGVTTAHLVRLVPHERHLIPYSGNDIRRIFNLIGPVQPLSFHSVVKCDGTDENIAFETVISVVRFSPGTFADSDLPGFASYNIDRLLRWMDAQHYFKRDTLFALLECLESLPPSAERALIKSAVQGLKTDRRWLWKMVDERYVGQVTPFLADGKADVRIGAAEWLRAHPNSEAIAPLRTAIRKERQDKAKAVMLMALEEQGESLEEFLSPGTLLADAQKALGKKNAVPKAIEWLNVDSLPNMRWSDGRPVDPAIITWFCATAVRNKTAEPSPILRRHLSNMDDGTVRQLGSMLFDMWVNEDLRTVTEEEAQATAEKRASQYLSYAQQHPNQPVWAQYAGQSVEQVAETLIGNYRNRMAGSATDSKGLLAVVAASAGSEVAERAFNYLKTHRGHRLSQGKAILQMLAWIDKPSTVQVVMAISTRFRPKGLQQEATKQAELLAARHGWTVDDLADRSVPDGGFGANGQQVIDYGERSFTAQLADDLSLTLTNDQTGKSIRSLPTGKGGEDADLIKDLKKDFASAKKELKSVAKLQPDRLHLAMCMQRSWTTDDFERYFLQHPVMSRLAARVVWIAHALDGSVVSFRPLTDGTLLSADDDEIEVAAGATITIAHDEILPAGQGSRWVEHFTDYELQSLLTQFGRPDPTTVSDQRVIDDFEGHMIDALKLRGQMNRLGWQLGQGQDGGWVFELFKPVSSFELRANLGLTGVNPYPEPHETALLKLYVTRSDSRNNEAEALPLADLPRILVRELYAEVAAIAAAGNRFDPDYRKKTP